MAVETTTTESVSDIVLGIIASHASGYNGVLKVAEDILPTDRLGGWYTHEIGPDLGEDSLDRAEIVLEIEDELDIDIPDEDAQAWKTVGDVVAYAAKKAGRE